MIRYMLDTNTVSHLLRDHPNVVRHIMAVPMASLCISVITEGELLFGLAKRPQATRLQTIVLAFLKRVDVLLWDRAAAASYGRVRAEMEAMGTPLSSVDMLIAAHACAEQALLVTNDRAFAFVPKLVLEDWTGSL